MSIVDSMNFLTKSRDFVELVTDEKYALDLRYATTNNFVGQNIYGAFNRAFVHTLTAQKLSTAIHRIQNLKPGYRLRIFDALRPRSVQRILWSQVVGTKNERYIANPELGSMHNFGFAVDLTVITTSGQDLDMGAGYDDFRDIAQPQLEARFLAEGLLSQQQLDNRHFLRSAMEDAGFKQLPHEWWHFDALEKSAVRQRFQIVE